MGMKLFQAGESQFRAVNAEVNRIYLENREEFEATCVCGSDGRIRYIYGSPPDAVMPTGVTFTPGLGTNVKHRVPKWRIAQKKRYDESRWAQIERNQ